MKVCLLSKSDGRGGGYAAAYRLHQGLHLSGVDSTMLVGNKKRDDSTVLPPKSNLAKGLEQFSRKIDVLPKLLYTRQKTTHYSCQWFPDAIASRIKQAAPDIINLHWVAGGYLQIETIPRFNRPLIWTLHDMWAFTGGCHYDRDCQRYLNSCGACPQLNSSKDKDLSLWLWQRKAKAWKNLDLTIVTPSSWLAKCASASSLFKNLRVEVIPNGIDLQQYRPFDPVAAKELLSLPKNKQLVLFGAVNATSDKRKGFHLLQAALARLSQNGWQNKIELVVFGASKPENPTNFGFKTHYLGKFNDDLSLNIVYSAADVFVAPSVQENLATTVLESTACGIPCVAFDIGGMPDLIEDRQNGYLAKPYQIDDLAQGIAWVLEDKQRQQKLAGFAREKAEREFDLKIVAHRYSKLFENVLDLANKKSLVLFILATSFSLKIFIV